MAGDSVAGNPSFFTLSGSFAGSRTCTTQRGVLALKEFFAVYGATKAFDLMLGEALWSELRGTGIDVLSVSPGETKTEFSSQAHFARGPGGMEPMPIVEGSLRRLGRGPSYVPGLANKFAAFLHRVLPRGWVAHATGAVLAKELLRTTPAKLRKKTADKS